MKKIVKISIITIIICIWMIAGVLWGSGDKPAIENRSFEINSSYITSGGGYKNTRIHVILKEQSNDIEKLFNEIREFHDKMNGESDRLEIYLYESREKLEEGKPVNETVFIKEE